MPLASFFQDQIDELRAFMASPSRVLHVVQYDDDLKQMLMKILVGIEEDEDNLHLMSATQLPFRTDEQFFSELFEELTAANEEHRATLAGEEIDLPSPQYWDDRIPARELFKQYFSAVADSLPEILGSYVLIIDPEEITNEPGYQQAMFFLAEETKSRRAKYIVLDQRQEALLKDVANYSKHGSIQTFYLPPGQIKKQIEDDLKNDRSLSPVQKRQYAAMLGAYAFSSRNYDEAEKNQRDALPEVLANGSPAEQANALYNLGNTCLGKEDFGEAESCFTRAAHICLEANLNPLLAMIMVNLGVALYHQRRTEEALESFEVGQRTFRALNHPPGEAHALDCKAGTLASSHHDEEAEQAWLEALKVYDSITAETLTDVRQSGRQDILGKLKRFYEETGQSYKIRRLTEQPQI